MPRSPRRGEIDRLKRDEAGKPRPVVIVSRNELNSGTTVSVVSFTTKQFPSRAGKPNFVVFEAGEGNLDERCLGKCSDVRVIDISELNLQKGVVGILDEHQMARISEAIKWSLCLM